MEPVCRNRMAVLVLGVAVLASAIGVRLYSLQIRSSDRWRERALSQHQRQVEVDPPRGLILDRHGRELAVSLETESLFAHPARVKQPQRAAALLAPVLAQPSRSILAKLTSDKPFVYLSRFMEPEEARRVRQLDLIRGDNPAFGLLPESRRYYPRGKLAVHVTGFATIDGVGVEGIEKQFDEELRGDPRVYLVTQDGLHRGLRRLAGGPTRSPMDIVLTLDLVLQHILERELDRAMTETGAASASAVMLDPATGQILALANRPTVDPARYGQSKPEERINRAVVHQYEPGSTFKVVPMAAALEREAIRSGELVNCRNGVLRLGDRLIHDVSAHNLLSAKEVLEKSSNIGMIEITGRLPPATLWEMIDRFGFGRRMGIELPGEASGSLRPVQEWNAYSYASLAFGHEIAVTTLQMASALAAIANGGLQVQPRIVLGQRDAAGQLHPLAPAESRRVMSSRSARELVSMLEGVITQGTGKRAKVEGYRLAGKSGTARALVGGKYSTTEFVASFGGFGPVGAPKLTVLVVLERPRGALHQGGEVAAPVFGRIMTDALAHLRVPADEELRLVEEAPPAMAATDPMDLAEPARRRQPTGPGQMPDLLGLGLRDAIRRLSLRGYRVRFEGHGLVAAQNPPAGSPLEAGATCQALLREPTPDKAVSSRPLLAVRKSR